MAFFLPMLASAAGSLISGALAPDAPSAQYQGVNIDDLIKRTSEQARRNIRDSIGLEEEFEPETAMAREEAMQQLLRSIRDSGDASSSLEDRLFADLRRDQDIEMPDLERSALLDRVRSQAMQDLELGGELPQDVRNLVMRTAAGRGSQSGVLGGRAGRDIGARDLGLTSLDLKNQRMATAAQLGAGEEATNMQRFGAAQFTQGINRPTAGLDPAALANIMVDDVNARNDFISGQARNEQAASAGKADIMGGVFQGMLSAFGKGGAFSK